jgi:hypothetical protein
MPTPSPRPAGDEWRIRRGWWKQLIPSVVLLLALAGLMIWSSARAVRSWLPSDLLVPVAALVFFLLQLRHAWRGRYRRAAPPDVVIERARFDAAKTSDGKRIHRLDD